MSFNWRCLWISGCIFLANSDCLTTAAADEPAPGVSRAQCAVSPISAPALPFSIKLSAEKLDNPPDYMSSRNPADMDYPYCPVVMDGEYWVIYKNGYHDTVYRFKGTNLETAVRQPDGTTDPAQFHGKYMLGGMWYDAADRKLYAFMHCETRGYYVNRDFGNLRQIGLASSVDKGLTWHDEGMIVTRDDPSQARPAGSEYSGLYWDGGNGDFFGFVDPRGGYVYLFSSHDVWPKLGQTLPFSGNILLRHQVARCSFKDKMAPGKWHKFYNGAWTEPGLGGKASYVNAYIVIYNEHLRQYLGFDSGGGLAVCSDLEKQDWSPSFVVPGACWGRDGYWAFTVSARDKRDISTCGRDFFIYQYWQSKPGRLTRVELDTGKTVAQGYYPEGGWDILNVTMDAGRLYAYGSLYESDDPTESRRVRRVGCDGPEVAWSEGWALEKCADCYGGMVRSSVKAGATMRCTFHGSAVYWRPFKGPDCGLADIILDGQPQGVVDCFANPATGYQFGFVKTGLDPKVEHTIQVVVRGEKGASPDARGVAVRHMLVECGCDTCCASDGFSSIQGKNGWTYLQHGKNAYEKLSFKDPVWLGAGGGAIGYFEMTPGADGVARAWTAPRDGRVRLEGSPALSMGTVGYCDLAVNLNGQILWSTRLSPGAGATKYDKTIEVKIGDAIYFSATALPQEEVTNGSGLAVVANLDQKNMPAELNQRKSGAAQVRWDPVVTFIHER